jgi:hypothetical protein
VTWPAADIDKTFSELSKTTPLSEGCKEADGKVPRVKAKAVIEKYTKNQRRWNGMPLVLCSYGFVF